MHDIPTKLLRRLIIARRKKLSQSKRDIAAKNAAKRLMVTPEFKKARRIALYLPAGGELSTLPILAKALEMGKQCYLPVLRTFGEPKLWFVRWQPGMALAPNKFGIAEPVLIHNNIKPAWSLDLMIMPLVAFDKKLNRIGMGSGYYDRTLAYLNSRKHWRKPTLIGYAYEFQHTKLIAAKSWDIGMNMVITQAHCYT